MSIENVQILKLPADRTRVRLSIVVPVYNEVASLDPFFTRIDQTFADQEGIQLQLLFVNDGSVDETLSHLIDRRENDPRISIIDFSRNFGKEAALTAGVEAADGDIVVPIDVDLQDPPELILEMMDKWREGFDVVLAQRSDRSSDSLAKRTTARWFYRLHNQFADPKIPVDVGDFRLMDRIVVDALKQLPESRRFMKGLLAWLGFRTTTITYVRPQRTAGESKFNGWKLWNLAIEGVTGFTITPLRVWCYLGIAISMLSMIFAAFIVVRVMIHGVDVPGYASLMVAVAFLGGLQLTGIGVLGEYIGRAYMESKRRPVYLVRQIYDSKEESWTSKRPTFSETTASTSTGTTAQKLAL